MATHWVKQRLAWMQSPHIPGYSPFKSFRSFTKVGWEHPYISQVILTQLPETQLGNIAPDAAEGHLPITQNTENI